MAHCVCGHCQLNRCCCIKQGRPGEKGSEFVTTRIRAAARVGGQRAAASAEREGAAMFSGEWESEGGLFAVGALLICGCVGAWKGVRRFGF